MATYIVDWQSLGLEGIPGKTSITLPQNTTNATSSSLVLTGKGLNNYGEIQQENFLRLLEHFASANPPPNPTVGQLWFDSSENALKYFTMAQTWKRIGGVIEVGPNPPDPAEIGMLWLNTDEEILYLKISTGGPQAAYPRYHGDDWVQVWPHVTTFAGMQEYNALATRINRIIGPPTTYNGQPYGWGIGIQLPIFTDHNTPEPFDNNAWTYLLEIMDGMSCMTGTSVPPRSPIGFIMDGRGTPPGWNGYGIVSLHDFWDNTNALLDAIEADRFDLAPGGAETAVLATHTRTALWNVTKTHTFTVNFLTALDATTFFNMGGTLDFKLSHTPSLSNAFNLSWQSFLFNQTGTTGIQFGSTNMRRNSVEVSTFGYSDLTTSFQQVYNANRIGAGSYYYGNDAGLTILARTTNGGASVEFQVQLREQYGPGYGTGDVVGSTMSSLWRRNPNNSCFVDLTAPVPTATQGGTFITAPADSPSPP